MPKLNCWEFMKCGKEHGRSNTDKIGVCPVAFASQVNGTNGGLNGGRVCWMVSDSICKVEHVEKECDKCEFYKLVHSEESGIIPEEDILKRLNKNK